MQRHLLKYAEKTFMQISRQCLTLYEIHGENHLLLIGMLILVGYVCSCVRVCVCVRACACLCLCVHSSLMQNYCVS